MPRGAYSMRAAGILDVLADRTVGYHPKLARIMGVKATVFVCQLLYWDGRGAKQDGWIWKTQKEMEDDTGLTRYEQEGARKKLREMGILEEKLEGIPAVLNYKLNFDALAAAIDRAYPEKCMESHNQDCGKPPNLIAENPRTISENTTENTSERISPNGDPKPSTTPLPGLEHEPPESVPPTLHKTPLSPETDASAYLFGRMAAEAQAKGRRPPLRFPTLILKEQFEEAEKRVGLEKMQMLIRTAINVTSAGPMKSIIAYVVKAAKNNAPQKQNVNGDLYNALVEALRLNPSASSQHNSRVSSLAEICQREGYTKHQIRKAGMLWWDTWPGNTGQGPADSQFVQKLEIVRKEGL